MRICCADAGLFLGVTYVRTAAGARGAAAFNNTTDASSASIALLRAAPPVALWFALAQTQQGLDDFAADATPRPWFS